MPPSYKDMFHAIPDGERSCKSVIGTCSGYKFHHCDTKHDGRQTNVVVGLYKTSESPKDCSTYWDGHRMWVEFTEEGDPFGDEVSGHMRKRSLERLSSHAEMAMGRAHRTHTYTVLVMRTFARLIRWDRSGAVMTEEIDYKEHPEILGEFFWRFARMTDEAQGYDPTVQLVHPGTDSYRLMDKTAEKKLPELLDYIRTEFQKSIDVGCYRYQLAVEDKERVTHRFLVGRPLHITPGLVGGGTRSYVAVDVEKEVFVHLKDQWRYAPDEDSMQQEHTADDRHPLRICESNLEGDILSYLNLMGVRNVPTVVCHGDVGGQVTATQEAWNAIVQGPRTVGTRTHSDQPSKLVHYRLVEEEVGRPLSEFESGVELVKIISDCIIAHEDAVALARVLHGDISPGNTLMYPMQVANQQGFTQYVWAGLLSDWECSKSIAERDTAAGPSTTARMGTWQFMSSAVLDDKSRRPMIEDELESFFYVILYYGVRYLKHNSKDVASFMAYFFDSYSFANGEYSCGFPKRAAVHCGELQWPDGRDVLFASEGSHAHPLNDLIETMLPWFQGRYHVMVREKELRERSASDKQVKGRSKTETNKYADVMLGEDIDYEDHDDSMKGEGEPYAGGDAIKFAKAASNLDEHRAMRVLLRRAVKCASWPQNDKSGDQLPKNCTFRKIRF
ncbi:hypothetical protein A0H81_06304 [Grifola frondosa]|uniref:Fungal-type protein kinase domain-containing protein n=1 Tax=Grifola frondosa TaxID=5627 RepID=A0A1C7MAF9_GRIFR|nr:hypothetical protein A0H81_06304 [Grifola frondosa]